jgi:RNA polymerase sigma-70 factor (ECF subfamily)
LTAGANLAAEYEQTADAELVRLTLGGDDGAFEEIVRRHSPRVFRFARRFFRQRDRVEEAAQEVFLKAYTQLGSYESRGSFEGWLTRITTTTCLNLIRTAERRPEATLSDLNEEESDWLENNLSDERQQSVEQSVIAADLADKVLGTLPPDDRVVLLLTDGEGATIKEVAAATGWSESKVKVQTFRARRRMREAVERLLSSGPLNQSRKTQGAEER